MKKLTTAVGALVVLLALLAGAPLALANWWGNPWPAGGWSELQLLTIDTLVGAIVAIGWLAWAQMTACILIEVGDAIRHGADYVGGRTARPVRFAAPGQQELARFLVTSVAALGLGTGVATGGAALYSTTTATAPAHADTTAVAPTIPSSTVQSHATAVPNVTTPTHTTAWKLAETYLGDGARWKEILELNRGTALTDGTKFTQGIQTIPAGTVLRLPADAILTPAGTTTGTVDTQEARGEARNEAKARSEQVDGAHIVEPGDTLWDIAEQELGDPYRYPELFEASQDTVQPGGAHMVDEDLILPGWTITIPGADEQSPAPEENREPEKAPADLAPDPAPEVEQAPQAQAKPHAKSTPHSPAESGVPEPTSREEIADDTDGADHDNVLDAPWILSGLTGAGVLLAGGLYLGLRQRRRAQFRARRPGRAIAVPGPELAATEMTIAAAGNLGEEPLMDVDAALRHLAGATYANRGVMPALAAVEITAPVTTTRSVNVGDGHLTLHLSEPGDLPYPWRPTPDRLHWHVPTTLPVDELGPLSDEADAPYPLLVTIGQAESGELWLINCEDLGVLTLTGDQDRGRDFARHLVAQLALNPWSRDVIVDCIGIAAEAEPLGDAIHFHATSAAAARATADAIADAVAMVDRATRHHTDVATGRTGQADDDVWPSRLVLVDAATEELEHLSTLVELVDAQVGRTATSIVLSGVRPDTPGTQLVFTTDGRVVLERAGLDLVAVSLTSEETRGVGLVYAQSEVLDDVEISADTTAEGGWEAYSDRTGCLRREHTLPRDTPENALTEPTTTLLDADDEDYLTQAAVAPEDLDALAPKVPASVRTEVADGDPRLDRDVADWFDENAGRAKISLLGPVLVRTHGKPLAKNRPFYTELAAFIWLHPNGVTRDQVVTAFGTAPDSVRKRMNALRDWFGKNPSTGEPFLPRADETPSARTTGINVYQFDKTILVDWDLFKRLRVRAETRGGDAGRADLAKALELVTGRPCDRCREQGWQWLAEEQRHDHYMQIAVADVALTLTTQFLRDGQNGRARAATEIAMLAAPDEEATRLCLVQITNAEGNRAEAERILREDICNRSDDGDAPPELNDRTQAIIRKHDGWMAS